MSSTISASRNADSGVGSFFSNYGRVLDERRQAEERRRRDNSFLRKAFTWMDRNPEATQDKFEAQGFLDALWSELEYDLEDSWMVEDPTDYCSGLIQDPEFQDEQSCVISWESKEIFRKRRVLLVRDSMDVEFELIFDRSSRVSDDESKVYFTVKLLP